MLDSRGLGERAPTKNANKQHAPRQDERTADEDGKRPRPDAGVRRIARDAPRTEKEEEAQPDNADGDREGSAACAHGPTSRARRP